MSTDAGLAGRPAAEVTSAAAPTAGTGRRSDAAGSGRGGVDDRGRVERRYPPPGPAEPLTLHVQVHLVDGAAGRAVVLAQGRAVRALLANLTAPTVDTTDDVAACGRGREGDRR